MDQLNIDKLATSCKDIALAIPCTHPYHIADSLGITISEYPDSEWLSYRIKLSIYKNTESSSIAWRLPEPKEPVVMIGAEKSK